MFSDALTDILRSLRLRGGVYFRCDFSAPWGMAIRPSQVAEFHLVTRGQCWLRLKSRKDAIPLVAGDVVVFPHGDAHAIVDAPRSHAVPAEKIVGDQSVEHYGPVVFGGDGITASFLCGYFEFDRSARHPLVAALPPLIHVRGFGASDFAWLQTTVSFIAHETREPCPGAEAVVNRLVEILFIQILRAHIESTHAPPGILAALADRQIAAALSLLHGAPEKPWSLASLGRQVAMSRSAFADRFARLVGRPPMEYLAQRRMEKARELLLGSGTNTAAVAQKVGYRSEAAFSKAFKKIVGIGPGAFRRGTAGGA